MKPKLIVMSHGNMALEAIQSASMIAGEIEGVYPISMEALDGLEGTVAKLNKVLEQLKDEKALIIADLFGGTPFNVANMACTKNANLRVISGLNLGMLIEYAFCGIEDLDELAAYMVNIGKQGVQLPMSDDDEIDLD